MTLNTMYGVVLFVSFTKERYKFPQLLPNVQKDVHIVIVPRGMLSAVESVQWKSSGSKGPSFALGFVSFFVFLCPCVSLICCEQMLSLARHSRSAASFIFRTACCYHHPPSASRSRGAFPASNRGLWQTSNIVRCSRPLRCGIPRWGLLTGVKS